MQRPLSNPLDESGLCLLSLDGGGVRGLSALYILKALMDRLNQERQAVNLPPKKPCEVFDLIGGTSTGGIIAIMLGRLEMDADECIAAYGGLMKGVFAERSSRLPFSLTAKTKARFDPAKLESAIKTVIRARGIPQSDLFNDAPGHKCKVFVCTVASETTTIKRLRSYSLPGHRDVPATICEAALATSAATSFFEPVHIGARKYVDGALGANNPVDEVEGEASNLWCPETGDLKPLVKCFVSIGTGNPGKKAIESNVLKLLSKTLVAIATETEKTADRFMARWRQHYDESRYFRFNVRQGLQGVGLEEYQEQGTIEAATDDYLEQQEQKFQFRDCVGNLKQKQRIQIERVTNWNRRFAGRGAQLADLGKKLFLEGQCPRVAIVGLGGVGKTQIALEMAYRIKDERPDCSVFWVPAISVESIRQSFLDIGGQLRVPGLQEGNADAMRLVQRYMCRESAGQWLLILDNADDVDMWFQCPTHGRTKSTEGSPLIDYLPRSSNGSIVFTTRNRKVAVKLTGKNLVGIEEMDEEVSAQLLRSSINDQDILKDHEAMTELLEQLTYLPLAIVQAAAYINENAMVLAEYLSLLNGTEEDAIELLKEDFEDEGRYRIAKNPIATTFLISFEQICNRDPLAADYLSFMSCLDPKAIPESLLPSVEPAKIVVEALGTLSAYSFITRRPADKTFDLHRLVHLATRNWLRERNSLAQWSSEAVARLSTVFPDGDHRGRAMWRMYLPHARHVLASGPHESIEERLVLLRKLGQCLLMDGKYDEAERPFTEVVETTTRELGPDHPSTLNNIANLATTYVGQGRWKDAEELFLQVMETSLRVSGREHPSAMVSMASLTSTYGKQGRWDEAEELFVQVAGASQRVLGREHPDALLSTANLAATYGHQGRLKEAEQLEVRVAETVLRVLGPEHPNTLNSKVSLGRTYVKRERWGDAEELFVQVKETSLRVFGREHPRTLDCMASLALIFRSQGRLDEAEELIVRVVEASKRVLGHDHPDTLARMSDLAYTLKHKGRRQEAVELMTDVAACCKRNLGPDHPHTGDSEKALSEWT